jgi:mRNA-degrading endonuclease RelE of RelBE toxin-antitoxin system
MAEVRLRKAAIKQLAKLPKSEIVKVKRKLEEIALSPTSGKMLKGEYDGFYSYRAWPYRIIYRFSHDAGVQIYAIEHRQGVYK